MRSAFALFAVVTVAALARPALGATYRPGGHSYRHDGLSLHMDVGLSYTKASYREGATDSFALQGPGVAYGVALGGAVIDNLIVAGHVWRTTAILLDVINGKVTSSSDNSSLALTGVGPNITYYIMPANVFLSVTPSITILSMASGSSTTTYQTQTGYGLHAAIGREWWASSDWGIGMAAQFMLSSNREEGSTDSFSTMAGAFVLSVTYN